MPPLQGPTILEMHEPEHAVYRKLHEYAFARSSMRRWEAELVRPLVERTIDRFAEAKRADLVEEVFMPIPVRVIAALIGLPEADVAEFHRLAHRPAGISWPTTDARLRPPRELKRVLRRHPRRPSARAQGRHGDGARRGRRSTVSRCLTNKSTAFMRNLLPAGAETTSRSTASLALGLLTHPDQLAAVQGRPRACSPRRSRRVSAGRRPLLNFMRETTCDVELGGVKIPAGSTVAVNLGSANHDETRWDNPATL